MRYHVCHITTVLLALAGAAAEAVRADLPMAPPGEGPVAFWSGEGHARDAAGTNHGTPKNGATYGPGRVGRAFKLDGVNDHIYVGNTAALRITGSQTIAMWIRI